MVNKPDILRPMSSKLTKEEYPKKALRTDKKKNNVLFCSCDDVIEPNEISNFARLFPYVDDLFWLNDFLNRFIRSRDIV